MSIALLGGSFDPPHLGHSLIIRQILELRDDIDKIILIPTFKHHWKPSAAGSNDRFEMTKFLMQERVEVSDIEIKRQGVSFAIDTVTQIKKQTHANLFWICGSDIVSEFSKWKDSKALLSLTKFLVFPRDPFHLPVHLPQGFDLIQDTNLIITNVSSSIIRERIKEKKSIEYLVLKEVEEYIYSHNLYT